MKTVKRFSLVILAMAGLLVTSGCHHLGHHSSGHGHHGHFSHPAHPMHVGYYEHY